jgi:O-antigen/teichoic acid export membrane protein
MRIKRTIINTIYTLGAYLILMALGLVTRRLFVQSFGTLIPGYAGMIESIFSFFAITELGVGSVISYRLYEKIGAHDTAQIAKYMALYRWAYRIIGVAIVCVAAVVAFFLPLIIVQPGTDWRAVYTIYILQMASTLSSYFLVTRRLMYTCTQRGYVCTRIDLIFNVANSFTRIAIALACPNYVLWFGVTVVYNTLANLLVARQYKKDFPEIRDVRVGWKEFKELGVFSDLKSYLVHRISNAVYGSSDNIVVTRMVGASAVTMLTNYSTVSGKVTELFNKILDAFSAAIGSIVYDQDAQADGHARRVFWGMDLFSYFIGSFTATAYFCLLQPFVTCWMGKDFLLPISYVAAFCLNEYVAWNHRMIGSYRAVLGRFEQDQWYMVASAVTNIVLSFALIKPFGLAGVVMATVLAHCMMWVGRARVVFRVYMAGSGWRYLRMQVFRAAVMLAEMAFTGWLCGFLGDGVAALLGDIVIVCLVPNAINLLVFWPTSDAAYLRERAQHFWTALQQAQHKGGSHGSRS